MFDRIIIGSDRMKNKSKSILINILVICLYFLWPYFFNNIALLINLSSKLNLLVSLLFNFVFMFIVIYIYKDKLGQYCNNVKKKLKSNVFMSLKIFFVGLIIYVSLNIFFEIINIPALSNSSMVIEIFEKIPVIYALVMLFYYPIIEEIIFKMSFKEIFNNKWSFIILTGVFNALFQIVFSFSNLTDLLYLIPCSAFFCSLSYVYYKTDNIIYPIFLRMCYNLIPCIIYMVDLLQ